MLFTKQEQQQRNHKSNHSHNLFRLPAVAVAEAAMLHLPLILLRLPAVAVAEAAMLHLPLILLRLPAVAVEKPPPLPLLQLLSQLPLLLLLFLLIIQKE